MYVRKALFDLVLAVKLTWAFSSQIPLKGNVPHDVVLFLRPERSVCPVEFKNITARNGFTFNERYVVRIPGMTHIVLLRETLDHNCCFLNQ